MTSSAAHGALLRYPRRTGLSLLELLSNFQSRKDSEACLFYLDEAMNTHGISELISAENRASQIVGEARTGTQE